MLTHIRYHASEITGGCVVDGGFFIEEITVEAVIFHNFNQLVRNVSVIANKVLNNGGIAAPVEENRAHDGNAVCVRRIGEFTCRHNDLPPF